MGFEDSDRSLNSKPVKIREVWSDNLESEFELISQVIDEYPFISMTPNSRVLLGRAIAANLL